MKWEYLVLNIENTANEQMTFNLLGENGWELVTVTGESEKFYSVAYFKRPKN